MEVDEDIYLGDSMALGWCEERLREKEELLDEMAVELQNALELICNRVYNETRVKSITDLLVKYKQER